MEKEKIEFPFIKADFKSLQNRETDQMKGLAMPKLQKEVQEGDPVFDLPQIKDISLAEDDIIKCIEQRRSRRNLEGKIISAGALSLMLWCTQGVKRIFKRSEDFSVTIRTVPSAGARHPFETYLIINRVEGFEQGIYRYLPLEHKLTLIKDLKVDENAVIAAANGQEFVGKANVVFLWTALPYRTSWRYGRESGKLILLDAGHICQNLYLAAEALGLGTCGIAAYDQELFDQILDLDGSDECVIYLAPVGSKPENSTV
jgi:SagB-type dehydrogenase family enzyme